MALLKRVVIAAADAVDEKRLVNEGKLSSKKGTDYVNNKKLYEEFVRYHELCVDAEEKGLPRPKMSDMIGRAIIQICTRRCNSYAFAGYTNNWKEEMIDHAIMTCAIKAHKFDVLLPNKNPFAYITSIANNAIFERINCEKKETYIKYKIFDEAHGLAADISDDNVDDNDIAHFNETDDIYHDRLDYISEYEQRADEKRMKNAKEKEHVLTAFDLLGEGD